jgi:hypothetical protein
MPGTDLARTVPSSLKFDWYHVLPVVEGVLPDTSTPARSGNAGTTLLNTDRSNLAPGGIYTYDCELSKRVHRRVFDREIGRRVVDDALEMLEDIRSGHALQGKSSASLIARVGASANWRLLEPRHAAADTHALRQEASAINA